MRASQLLPCDCVDGLEITISEPQCHDGYTGADCTTPPAPEALSDIPAKDRDAVSAPFRLCLAPCHGS